MITHTERQMLHRLAMAYVDSVRRIEGGLPRQGLTEKEVRFASDAAYYKYDTYLDRLEEK